MQNKTSLSVLFGNFQKSDQTFENEIIFYNGIDRAFSQTKIGLLLEIKWKQRYYLYTKVITMLKMTQGEVPQIKGC
jgi:hypothetical protein